MKMTTDGVETIEYTVKSLALAILELREEYEDLRIALKALAEDVETVKRRKKTGVKSVYADETPEEHKARMALYARNWRKNRKKKEAREQNAKSKPGSKRPPSNKSKVNEAGVRRSDDAVAVV